jgi:hypothetical protein
VAEVSQREKQLESELEAAQRQSRELAAERDKLKSATQAEDQAVQVGVCGRDRVVGQVGESGNGESASG